MFHFLAFLIKFPPTNHIRRTIRWREYYKISDEFWALSNRCCRRHADPARSACTSGNPAEGGNRSTATVFSSRGSSTCFAPGYLERLPPRKVQGARSSALHKRFQEGRPGCLRRSGAARRIRRAQASPGNGSPQTGRTLKRRWRRNPSGRTPRTGEKKEPSVTSSSTGVASRCRSS